MGFDLAAGPTIALSMGERGLPARLLAPKYGAFLTFGALRAGKESAPGVVILLFRVWCQVKSGIGAQGKSPHALENNGHDVASLRASAVVHRCRAAHGQPVDDPVPPTRADSRYAGAHQLGCTTGVVK
jgi:Type I 3-dehydroquinase